MSDLNKMPPIFLIGRPSARANASNDYLGVQEIDWTHSEQAASVAFTYGWVRASDAQYLVESIERLRVRVAQLEEVVRFYADIHTWKSASVFMCGHDGNSRATIDRGEKAREALRSLGKSSAK